MESTLCWYCDAESTWLGRRRGTDRWIPLCGAHCAEGVDTGDLVRARDLRNPADWPKNEVLPIAFQESVEQIVRGRTYWRPTEHRHRARARKETT